MPASHLPFSQRLRLQAGLPWSVPTVRDRDVCSPQVRGLGSDPNPRILQCSKGALKSTLSEAKAFESTYRAFKGHSELLRAMQILLRGEGSLASGSKYGPK